MGQDARSIHRWFTQTGAGAAGYVTCVKLQETPLCVYRRTRTEQSAGQQRLDACIVPGLGARSIRHEREMIQRRSMRP